MTQATNKPSDVQALDALTAGAFSAPTSGERAARVRAWLSTQPPAEQMQEVFRELSGRDKGAAKPLREKLDELKRAKSQETLGSEWTAKGQALLDLPRLNIADALAWQRDAARAGAPLSREPLASLKVRLADRVKGVEDLQLRVQVQREAAVLLAQRIEVLSTKPWRDAQLAWDALRADVPHWQSQADALAADPNWASVEGKFPPLLEASRAQLQVVWDAFQAALSQAVAAAEDPAAPLPPVPVWAEQLRAARGGTAEAATPRPPRAKVDPELRARSNAAVRETLARLEQEIAEGHGKASAGAAAALRNALKEHGKLIDDKLELQAQAALSAADDLGGWQRWRADQLREELVAKAEGLLKRPEGQAIGGRKMQETLRALREQWKLTDQGGIPNHGLWKRFDEACNEAYKVVEAWLEKIKTEAAQNKAQRLALIEELKAWAAENATARDGDWKGFNRILHQFGDRWRDAGHLSEKAFAEMQPLWKDAMNAAAAPLAAMQKRSLEARQAMIEEATALGAAPVLRIDAVKALQQRWQAEAQTVPLDRKHEQKLWDAFRKPIDDAFNRKTQEREKAASALSERDRIVLDASKALTAANASGYAQKIRAAMAALEAALRGQAQAAAVAVATAAETESRQASAAAGVRPPDEAAPSDAAAAEPAQTPEPAAQADLAAAQTGPAAESATDAAPDAAPDAATDASPAPGEAPAPAAPPKPAPKPVIAMRGDDRPGMKKTEPAQRGGRFGDRKDGPRGARPGDNKFEPRRDDRAPRFESRDDRGPRLGDVAFRAQRDALESAQMALKKLAAQAHGEALSQLMTAWEQRAPDQVPGVQELGRAVSPAVRTAWTQALGAAPSGDAAEALLRLEIASEAPTPAEHIAARRMLQLQLLTKRNAATPAETWGQDAARVLASAFEAQAARRLQNALKALLRR